MDVIFYFVVSLLVSTVFCYLILLTKNNIQRQEMENDQAALQTVGTQQQKDQEKEVINYQRKINDFSNLLKNHEFASNAFIFVEKQTVPNIWFKQFSLEESKRSIQLSGEAEDMDSYSRQIAILEKNKTVKSIGALNSSLGQEGKVAFNLDVILSDEIFNYRYGLPPVIETTTPSDQAVLINNPLNIY